MPYAARVLVPFAPWIWAGILALQIVAGTAMAQPAATLAPIIYGEARNRIPGSYMVIFNSAEAMAAAASKITNDLKANIRFTFTKGTVGYAISLTPVSPQDAEQQLRLLNGVKYVEADRRGKFQMDVQSLPLLPGYDDLDRIDQRLLPTNQFFTYTQKGENVDVYVLDSGVYDGHTEFEGRAEDVSVTTEVGDCSGHGTYVAGIIGAKTFGVAKKVRLHSVRVGGPRYFDPDPAVNGWLCDPSASSVIAGLEWVMNDVTTNHRVSAVVNLSLAIETPAISDPDFDTMEQKIRESIVEGITYVVSAPEGADACNYSPSRIPEVITVTSAYGFDDVDQGLSWGDCIDLFAPGAGIESAQPTNLHYPGCTQVPTSPTPPLDSQTQFCGGGTSSATALVTGCAAMHLEYSPGATDVWDRLLAVANVSGTFVGATPWPGIQPPPATTPPTPPPGPTPNVLLHCGALKDLMDDGDPHLTVADGTTYDFQSDGEFVALRDGNGMQIQTRQTALTTIPPFTDRYTGLTSCVSANTALAARVGERRVTYQGGPSGMQLRVDGELRILGPEGIVLGDRARVTPSALPNGIDIDFPNGTSLSAIAYFWGGPQNIWFLSINVFHTIASEGLLGQVAPGSWLPALPDGTSLGPMPASLQQRYVSLYQTFANAWRVTNAMSLFDYAPGTSTSTFTDTQWPPENPPCAAAARNYLPASAINVQTAQQICRAVIDKRRNDNCVFDVAVTGEAEFAELYLGGQRIETGSTKITVRQGENSFVATVSLRASARKGTPMGAVQFTLDGVNAGQLVVLDERGQATFAITPQLRFGNHQVAARFVPASIDRFLPSTSFTYPVRAGTP